MKLTIESENKSSVLNIQNLSHGNCPEAGRIRANGSSCYTFVCYADVSGLDLTSAMRILPKTRREAVENFKFEKDKKLSAGAWLLLEKALLMHHCRVDDYRLSTTEKGKPYLEGCPFEFSLSHSGIYVAAALSTQSVGVDIQEIKPVDEKLLKYVCNENDLSFYRDSSDQTDAFYRIWTLKEALLKKSGDGLSTPMTSLHIDYQRIYNEALPYQLKETEADRPKYEKSLPYPFEELTEGVLKNSEPLLYEFCGIAGYRLALAADGLPVQPAAEILSLHTS